MWEQWIYKTIIAFLSIQILQIVFKKHIVKAFKKCNTNGVGFIRGLCNSLLVSMIPFFRWVFVALIVIVVIAGASIEEEKNEEIKDN